MLQVISSSNITDYEYTTQDVLPPDEALRVAAVSAVIGKPISMLLQCFPSLNSAAIRLAEQLTHLFPTNMAHYSLLARSLENALYTYRKAATLTNDQREIPGHFLQALLDSATGITAFEVRAVDEMGEGERWDMLRTPLTNWIARRPGKRIVFTQRDSDEDERAAARVMLSGQILSMNDAKLLQRLPYLQTEPSFGTVGIRSFQGT